MYIARCSESVVNGAVVLKVSVYEFESTLGFFRDNLHSVGDLYKLRGCVLPPGGDLNLGTLVLKVKELACTFEILQEAR